MEDFKKHSYKGCYSIMCKNGSCVTVYYSIHHPLQRGPGNKFLLEFMWGKAAFLDKEEAPLEQHQVLDNPSQFLVFLDCWWESEPEYSKFLLPTLWYNGCSRLFKDSLNCLFRDI